MDGFLRQSTASQSRLIGPFIDSTDFISPATGLTIANTDVKLRADGTTLSNKNSGGGTHQVNGEYSLTWDATDTANVGQLKYNVTVAGALPVFGTYTVLEEAVYDAQFAASAPGYVANAAVNVAQFGGVNGTFSSGRPEVNTTHAAGTAWGSGAVTAAALATDAVAEIADGVWDEAIAGHLTGGSTGAALSAAGSGGDGSTLTDIPWNSDWDAEVQSEVTDALAAMLEVARTEPAQGAPASNATALDKLDFLYKLARNRITQTSTTLNVYANNDSTVDHKATVSDDGATYVRGKIVSGP